MKKYFIWSLGCQMNTSDAERIASVLFDAKLSEASNEEEADVIVTVACSVRQTAIDRIYGKVRKWQRIKNKRPLITILSGCVLDVDKKKLEGHFDLMFDSNDLQKLSDFLNLDVDRGSLKSFFDIKPKYNSTFLAYVPIMTGCDNFCTYCAVPYAKGREVSRPKEEIISEVSDLIGRGYKEIILLGQNVNSFGNISNFKFQISNSKTPFIELIKEIDKIPGEHRIYFYSNHPKDMSDELIDTMAKLKHFPHYIHLPLQSGSDRVIREMNRHYTSKQYLEIVRKLKKSMPDVSITTDIIVGFPGETKGDFERTAEIMKEVRYTMPFIAKYSPRPGTPAAKMKDDVSSEEKERRFKKLTKIQSDILEVENAEMVGRTYRALVEKKKKDKYYARLDSYKIVELPENKTDLIGRFCEVKIIESSAWMSKGNAV